MEPKKNHLSKIRSNYILKQIFNNLQLKILLKIIKYNKALQKRIGINKKDYQNYLKIIIELIPLKNINTYFINIDKGFKSFCHIYFDDNEKEVNRYYLKENDKIKKIKIVLDYEIKSLSRLFQGCECIEKINFINFNRKDIYDMSYMFYGCKSLKEINFNNFNTDNVTNMSFMFSCCINLTSINLSKFNTEKVSNMTYMFIKCSNLKNVTINKNFINLENLINNKDYIKNNYYLINSIKYKYNSSNKFFGSYINSIKRELNLCLFDMGFQIISLIDDTLIGVLEGSIFTSYENGFFYFKIKYPKDYPFIAPKFYFITKIFHPNINEDGLVSYIFYNEWSPALRTKEIILTVQSLLGDPYPDNFLNQEAGKLYKENKTLYEDTVKDYVNKYANYSIYKNKLKEYEVEDLFHINEN